MKITVFDNETVNLEQLGDGYQRVTFSRGGVAHIAVDTNDRHIEAHTGDGTPVRITGDIAGEVVVSGKLGV